MKDKDYVTCAHNLFGAFGGSVISMRIHTSRMLVFLNHRPKNPAEFRMQSNVKVNPSFIGEVRKITDDEQAYLRASHFILRNVPYHRHTI